MVGPYASSWGLTHCRRALRFIVGPACEAAGEHEDAMYEAGVAKKYEEAYKHVSEIWDERQKKQADDRGQMAAERSTL